MRGRLLVQLSRRPRIHERRSHQRTLLGIDCRRPPTTRARRIEPPAIADEEIRKLQALGYLGASGERRNRPPAAWHAHRRLVQQRGADPGASRSDSRGAALLRTGARTGAGRRRGQAEPEQPALRGGPRRRALRPPAGRGVSGRPGGGRRAGRGARRRLARARPPRSRAVAARRRGCRCACQRPPATLSRSPSGRTGRLSGRRRRFRRGGAARGEARRILGSTRHRPALSGRSRCRSPVLRARGGARPGARGAQTGAGIARWTSTSRPPGVDSEAGRSIQCTGSGEGG